MAVFTIEEVCLATGGRRISTEEFMNFTGVSTDTRRVQKGDLFIPLLGATFDGHNFIQQAVENGASGVLLSRNDITIPFGVTKIFVEDTLKALQDLARFHRRRFRIPIVAVTGSNGKTTTKDMAAAVLGSQFHVLKTEANFNNEIGLPLTLLQLTDEHEAAVVEMGMRGKGQIRQLAEIALPTIAIITNVGESHLELLGSVENIAEAKAELLEAIPENGVSILNGDDSYVRKMASKARGRVRLFGLQEGDVKAEEIHIYGQSIRFVCRMPEESFTIEIPTTGKHNVYNALAAVALGVELGMKGAAISSGFKNFSASPMRLHIERVGQYVVINDAYNASPLSMAAAIDTMIEVASGRKVAVLGDMLELGAAAVAAHEAIGEKLAKDKIDAVITVGKLAATIANKALSGGIRQVSACFTHEQAQAALSQILQPGDTVLVKGSRGMKMETIIKMLY